MVQLCAGNVHVTVSQIQQTQAKIHVVIIAGERFIKSAGPFKRFPPHHHAGGRDRRIVALDGPLDNGLTRGTPMDVCGKPILPDDDARMLKAAIFVEKLRAGGSDRRTLRFFKKRPDPAGRNDFGVVVEEQKVRRTSRGGAGVYDRREIEWVVERYTGKTIS